MRSCGIRNGDKGRRAEEAGDITVLHGSRDLGGQEKKPWEEG